MTAADEQTTPDAPAVADGSGPARIRCVDDRLGLAIDRVGLSARTLVTYARDHVTVRTPSRPDFRDGNTIDLLQPPAAKDLPGWIERFGSTIGTLGTRHVQIRWETPLASGDPIRVPDPDPVLAAALEAEGFALSAVTVLLLDALDAPPPSDMELVSVDPPCAAPGGAVDRRWHASTVLYRYLEGEGPQDWEDADLGFVNWQVDVQRELARAGRARVWLASRHGGPVARLTLTHDRQGLAVVEDVVVHPVHRRRGIASAVVHRAVSHHLVMYPGSRVGIGAEPASPAEHLYRRLGFRPHATIWSALRSEAD